MGNVNVPMGLLFFLLCEVYLKNHGSDLIKNDCCTAHDSSRCFEAKLINFMFMRHIHARASVKKNISFVIL